MNDTDSRTRNIVNNQILAGGYFDDSLGFESLSNPSYDTIPMFPTDLSISLQGWPIRLSDATSLMSWQKRNFSLYDSAATSIKPPKENTLSQYVDMVKTWKSTIQPHHFAGLNSRLEFIFEDEPELGLKQKKPNDESFSALLAYIATKPEFKTPSISYNRDGSFSASWQTDKKVRLTLDFIGLTRIRWIFVDSKQGLEQVISGAGIVPNNMLQSILDSYGGLEWMRR